MGTNQYVDLPERQCHGKFKFTSKQRAKRFLKRARTMNGRGDVMPYTCPHCGYYHLGTKPGVKKRRRLAAEKETRYTESNSTDSATGGGEG